MSRLRFKSIIIGTGPCGVLTAGLFAGVHGKSALWVGDSQGVDAIGGRFNQYASVPGNTPVSSFEEAFRMVPLLAEHTPKLSADADGTCPLGHVFPTLVDFSERIAQTCSTSFGTRVTALHLDTEARTWTVHTDTDSEPFQAANVIFVPGAVPRPPPPQSNHKIVNVLDAVQPGHAALASLRSSAVSVVGNSHTAMLIVKNLIEAGVSQIRVFQKSPLRHAETQPAGWTKYDGTGLKGSVSRWVKKQHFRGVSFVDVAPDQITEELIDERDVVIWATGFVRGDNMPALVIDGVVANHRYDEYDGYCGEIAPGLYGGGIGFPERWTDPEGYSEYRVGFNPPFVAHMTRILKQCEGE